jgi:DUF4097 and DUF4098 domain-containing protein YvlB
MANGTQAPRRSLAGPIVLIVIGSVFLLRNLGYPIPLLQMFAQYWPVLIILWGVIKLIEYMVAKQEGRPAAGIGAGGYFLLFFLIMFGLAASQARRVDWEQLRTGIDMDGEFLGLLGSRYDFSEEMQSEFPAGARLNVSNERGGVKVVASEGGTMRVVVRKRVFAGSQGEAERLERDVRPSISVAGGVVRVQAERNRGATLDLEIHAPRQAALEVMAVRGDVEVEERAGDIKVHASRGSVRLAKVEGSANVHLRRGDFTARDVTGDVAIEGRVDNSTIENVGGQARMAGDFFGEIRVVNVARTVTFKSSRTDLEFGRLDGELVMAGSRTTARTVEGPVRLLTRSKEIRIDDFSGDLRVENSNGGVRLQASRTLGNVEVENRRGNIELELPAKTSFQLDARARRGDIRSEFGGIQVVEEGGEARATGTVGTGGPRVRIQNESGSIEIRAVN